MFCTNCGKEIGENTKFCPECGAPANMTADTMDASSEPKISGTGDYEMLRQLTEKAGKAKKVTRTVTTILIFVYVFIMVRGLFSNFMSVLEGREEPSEFLLMIFAVILLACALLHVGLEIILPILQGRKAVQAEEYLKYLRVSDRRALMHALAQMQCSSVKNVYMDEHGDVCVAGKKSKHTFTVQNDIPVMTSRKNNYKAVLERETIAGCLLKFLVPEAPVNAYENEKSNARLSRMRLLILAIAVISGLVLFLVAVVFGTGNRYINMVKDGYPEIYPTITYQQAFEAFFSNCEWEYFPSDDGQDVVEFNGNCFYDDDRVTVTIQFLIYEDLGTFEVYTAAIDHKVQPELVYSLLLLNVFESYGAGGETGRLQLEDSSYIENEKPVYNESVAEVPEYEEPTYSANVADAPDDVPVEVSDTVAWESIYMMAGRWSDGNIEISVSIYSDAEEYAAYEEVGTCFLGEILGTLYFVGSDGINQYLMCELDQGDSFVLQYWGDEMMKVMETSENLRFAEETILYCEEHYVS